jgi:hypothetical protein
VLVEHKQHKSDVERHASPSCEMKLPPMTESAEGNVQSEDLIGETIQLQCLHKETLNGQRGQVLSFDGVTRRYAVKLEDGRQLAVKPVNVRKCASGQRRVQRQVSKQECIQEAFQYIDDVACEMFGDEDAIGPPHITQLMGRCATDLCTALSELEKGRYPDLKDAESPVNIARYIINHIVQWRTGTQARELPKTSLIDDVSMYLNAGMTRWAESP